MRETLRDSQSRFGSGRGIAAPQIGAPVRMVYIEMDKPWVLINPEIVDIGNDDFTVWDDCFSFPNLLVRVSAGLPDPGALPGPQGRLARGRARGRPGGAAAARDRPPRWRARGGPAARARSVLSPGGVAPAARAERPLRDAGGPQRDLRHSHHGRRCSARTTGRSARSSGVPLFGGDRRTRSAPARPGSPRRSPRALRRPIHPHSKKRPADRGPSRRELDAPQRAGP